MLFYPVVLDNDIIDVIRDSFAVAVASTLHRPSVREEVAFSCFEAVPIYIPIYPYQDIAFVADGGVADILRKRLGSRGICATGRQGGHSTKFIIAVGSRIVERSPTSRDLATMVVACVLHTGIREGRLNHRPSP